MRIEEDVVVGFIKRNLMDRGLTSLWEDERFRSLRDLVADGKEIAAAKEYQSLTGAGLPECQFAVTLFAVAAERGDSAR